MCVFGGEGCEEGVCVWRERGGGEDSCCSAQSTA